MFSQFFDRIVEIILHLKLGTAAAVLIVGMSGVLITATVVGDEVRIRVFAPVAAHTTEGAGCDAALAARREALTRLDDEVARARADLRTLRDLAEELAERTDKDLSDETLDAAERDVRTQMDAVRTRARDEIGLAAVLSACEDSDPNTGVVGLDIADLRQRYRVIVDRAVTDLRAILVRAGELFDRLVREARMERVEAGGASASGSGSGD